MNSRVENKYKKSSSHIASLYGNPIVESSSKKTPKQLTTSMLNSIPHMINKPTVNQNHLISTLFSPRPTINHPPITNIGNDISIFNARVVENKDGGSRELNNQEMEIETSVIRETLKRGLEIDSNTEVNESATKKLKM